MEYTNEPAWVDPSRVALARYQAMSYEQQLGFVGFKLPDDFESSSEEFDKKFKDLLATRSAESDLAGMDIVADFARERRNLRMQCACVAIQIELLSMSTKDLMDPEKSTTSPALEAKLKILEKGPIKLKDALNDVHKLDKVNPLHKKDDIIMRNIMKNELASLMMGTRYSKSDAEQKVFNKMTAKSDQKSGFWDCVKKFFSETYNSIVSSISSNSKNKNDMNENTSENKAGSYHHK